jgi:Recombination endonuclease VII
VIVLKICSKCNKSKSVVDFYRASNMKSGYRNSCKECDKQYNKKWQNKSTSKETWRKASNRYDHRVARRKRLYGLSDEAYQALLVKQNNRCGICQQRLKIACVDHDHATGKVRGLLCSRCNRSIGLLGDSKEALQRALDYIAG